MPLRTVLFDLDGTLLDNDMDVFITHFLRHFAPHVAHLVTPDRFVQAWLHAWQVMLRNTDPGLTNQQVFDLNFYPRIGVLRRDLLPSAQAFYATSHRSLRRLVRPQPGAREAVQAMIDAGMDVVIATHPIFPLVALEQRLEWAGVSDFEYRLITSSENMHATKPHLQYYQEILTRIDRAPAECLMVGDDFINDIQPVTRLRMRTYWVNTTTTTPPNFDPAARGEMRQLCNWLVRSGLLEHQA